ncbi:MAG: polyprenyl synthetase family protein [Coriobacteriales bacterium]|nr:polyprenyl synthetase family protein [Coriobacteriales bacterium]
MSNGFETYLDEHHEDLDALIVSYYKNRGSHKDMATYLYDPLYAFAANGGKRHRPAVCFLGCAAVGGDLSLAVSSAAAVEHFHTAALIHDDIADEGELRRGVPCLHISQGVGLAINSGDLALSQVTGTVLQDNLLNDATKIRVLQELVDMTTRTIEGQALDIGWARDGRWDITLDDYVVMANHKTAYYSVAVPLACGAIVGGGTHEQVEALRAFGMNTGLAFQLQDDLLNLVGEKESVRKDFRTDITEGKRTMLMVHALTTFGDDSRAQELRGILNSHTSDPAKLARAVDMLYESGSIEFVREYSLHLIESAKEEIEPVAFEAEPKQLLKDMADFFVQRLV